MTLDAFWIDRTEVTNAQYARCVSAGKCAAPSQTKSRTRDLYYGNGEYADYPVIFVSWDDANELLHLGRRATTDRSAVEYAARGPNDHTYPWGNTFDATRLNFCDKNCPLDGADKK